MRLSLQLYTVRDLLSQDIPGTFRALAETGLKYVEGGYLESAAADAYESSFRELGLQMSGAHISPDVILNQTTDVLAFLDRFNVTTVIIPWVQPDTFANEASLLAFAEKVSAAGEHIVKSGRTFLYHNHDFEITAQGGNASALKRLFELVPAELVGAELDLGWVHVGGYDPVVLLRELGARVKMLHLKDVNPALDPQWRPAGEGLVDFETALSVAAELGIPFGAIELDYSPNNDPLAAVATSVKYFNARGVN